MSSTQGEKLEVEINAEIIEEHCLLTGSSWFAQYSFLYHPRPRAQHDTTQYTECLARVKL